MASSPPVARLDSLTGLRFVAALLVFGYHIRYLFTLPSWLQAAGTPGPVGVSFFFILSGFVLTWSRRADDSPIRFYRRRVARIAPSHLLVWILVLGLMVLEGATIGGRSTVLGLALLQAWVPKPYLIFAVNGVAWSLSCEVFFYAVFPFLIPVVAGATSARRRLLMGACLAGMIAIAGFSEVALSGTTKLWFPYVFPPARFLEFLLGLCLALEIRNGMWPRVPLLPALALAAVGYAAVGVVPQSFGWAVMTAVPFALVIGSAAQLDLAGRPSLLGSGALVALGTWSYAFYLIHEPLIRLAIVGNLGRGPGAVWLGMPILLAVTVAASWLLFRLWERPFERRLRGTSKEQGRRPVGAAGVGSEPTRELRP